MLIDSHAHLSLKPAALESLLDSMNRLDIDQAVVVGGGLVDPSKLQEPGSGTGVLFNNLALLELCEKAEGRLLPFYFANPWAPPDQYADVGPRFHGLKLGPVVHGCPLTSPQTRSYLDLAARFRHPVYLHCLEKDGLRVTDLCRLAEDYPSLSFILGHGGVGHLDYAAIGAIAPFANIFYETSGSFKATVAKAVATLGPHRVLFGSEHPLQSAAAELAKINDLGLSDEALSAITGGNIARLLRDSKKEVACAVPAFR